QKPKGVWIIPASYDPINEFQATDTTNPYSATCVIKSDSALWGENPADEDGWLFSDLMLGLSEDMIDGNTTTFNISGLAYDIIVVLYCGIPA
ncbi:MAG: hypothetical protein LBM99_03950, partial [Bacillales bacterium]|nr:hypothetical protein [Bacillales bacterium]